MSHARLTVTLPEVVWIGAVSRAYPDVTFEVLAALPADEQADLHAQRLQVVLQVGVVLLGQDLRRRHEGALAAVVECVHHGGHGHDGLAAAHVALHQAVHLVAALGVGQDVFERALLRAGERIEVADPWDARGIVAPDREAAFERAIGGHTAGFSFAYVPDDETRLVFDLVLTPLFDDGGDVEYILLEGTDVSGRERTARRATRPSRRSYRSFIHSGMISGISRPCSLMRP